MGRKGVWMEMEMGRKGGWRRLGSKGDGSVDSHERVTCMFMLY